MSIPEITANAVMNEANLVYKAAADRLLPSIDTFHARGYHAYSAALGNMRGKFEKAMLELVDELMDDITTGPGERGTY